jgi:hypothetical protein
MKKITWLMFLVSIFVIVSCTTESGDSFGYQTPPASAQDMDSTEAGSLQQPGGIVSEIEDNQGNPTNDSDLTIRE